MTIVHSLERSAEVLKYSKSVIVFAGAGLSAESGLPTFRDQGGLWEGHRVEDVAEPGGFTRDPLLVWRFYAERQTRQLQVQPNAGHFALAQMETHFPDFLLVTQNVDNLSERAGSQKIVKIHGDLMEVWCSLCSWKSRLDMPVVLESLRSVDDIPRCPKCAELVRPGVVWFGEMLPPGTIDVSLSTAAKADVLLIVGTSGLVSGGYGLAETTKASGGTVVEINPAETYLSGIVDICIRSASSVALPKLLALIVS